MGPQVWITEVIFKSNSFLANSRDQLEPVVTQIPNHVATQYDKYLLQIYLRTCLWTAGFRQRVTVPVPDIYVYYWK